MTEYEKEIDNKEIETVVGLDFAMDGLYVIVKRVRKPIILSFYREMLDKLAKAQRSYLVRKKGSARWNKQRIRVAKLHEKVANQRKNFLHHESKELASNFDAVSD